MGFKHRKITPLWPKGNSEVERFMRTVKKIVKSSLAQSHTWKQEVRDFLLACCATPHIAQKRYHQLLPCLDPKLGQRSHS